MNKSNYIHTAWALLIQAITVALSGDAWAGAAIAIAFFTGREHAQREVRILLTRTAGTRLKWYEGFRHWSTDATWDVALPAATCLVVAQIWDYLS